MQNVVHVVFGLNVKKKEFRAIQHNMVGLTSKFWFDLYLVLMGSSKLELMICDRNYARLFGYNDQYSSILNHNPGS